MNGIKKVDAPAPGTKLPDDQNPVTTPGVFSHERWMKDGYETAVEPPFHADGPFTPLCKPAPDTDPAFDGYLVGRDGTLWPPGSETNVPAVLPDNGVSASETVYFVNGIMTDTARQQSDMQALANLGLAVRGVHNATEGFWTDVLQCLADKEDRGRNPAVATVADLLYHALKNGEALHVVGHSQGALIISCALEVAARHLVERDHMEAAEVQARLARVRVETFGGAGTTFVDGPQYVHYVNTWDIVPQLFGVGYTSIAHAGVGAHIVTFAQHDKPHDLPPLSAGLAHFFARFVDSVIHGPREIYFKHRLT